MQLREPGVRRGLKTLAVIAVVMLGGLTVARVAEVGLSANKVVAVPKDANVGSRSDPAVELPGSGASVLQGGSGGATTPKLPTTTTPKLPTTTTPRAVVPSTTVPAAAAPPPYTPPSSGVVSPDRQVLVLSGDSTDHSGGSGDAKEASGGG